MNSSIYGSRSIIPNNYYFTFDAIYEDESSAYQYKSDILIGRCVLATKTNTVLLRTVSGYLRVAKLDNEGRFIYSEGATIDGSFNIDNPSSNGNTIHGIGTYLVPFNIASKKCQKNETNTITYFSLNSSDWSDDGFLTPQSIFYVQTKDDTKQSGKKYYIKNSDGKYEEFSNDSFSTDVTYYEIKGLTTVGTWPIIKGCTQQQYLIDNEFVLEFFADSINISEFTHNTSASSDSEQQWEDANNNLLIFENITTSSNQVNTNLGVVGDVISSVPKAQVGITVSSNDNNNYILQVSSSPLIEASFNCFQILRNFSINKEDVSNTNLKHFDKTFIRHGTITYKVLTKENYDNNISEVDKIYEFNSGLGGFIEVSDQSNIKNSLLDTEYRYFYREMKWETPWQDTSEQYTGYLGDLDPYSEGNGLSSQNFENDMYPYSSNKNPSTEQPNRRHIQHSNNTNTTDSITLVEAINKLDKIIGSKTKFNYEDSNSYSSTGHTVKSITNGSLSKNLNDDNRPYYIPEYNIMDAIVHHDADIGEIETQLDGTDESYNLQFVKGENEKNPHLQDTERAQIYSLTDAIQKIDRILGSQGKLGQDNVTVDSYKKDDSDDLRDTVTGLKTNVQDNRPYKIAETNIIDTLVEHAADIGELELLTPENTYNLDYNENENENNLNQEEIFYDGNIDDIWEKGDINYNTDNKTISFQTADNSYHISFIKFKDSPTNNELRIVCPNDGTSATWGTNLYIYDSSTNDDNENKVKWYTGYINKIIPKGTRFVFNVHFKPDVTQKFNKNSFAEINLTDLIDYVINHNIIQIQSKTTGIHSLISAIRKIDDILGNRNRLGEDTLSINDSNETNQKYKAYRVTGTGRSNDKRPYNIPEANVIDTIVHHDADIGEIETQLDKLNESYNLQFVKGDSDSNQRNLNLDSIDRANIYSLTDAIQKIDRILGSQGKLANSNKTDENRFVEQQFEDNSNDLRETSTGRQIEQDKRTYKIAESNIIDTLVEHSADIGELENLTLKNTYNFDYSESNTDHNTNFQKDDTSPSQIWSIIEVIQKLDNILGSQLRLKQSSSTVNTPGSNSQSNKANKITGSGGKTGNDQDKRPYNIPEANVIDTIVHHDADIGFIEKLNTDSETENNTLRSGYTYNLKFDNTETISESEKNLGQKQTGVAKVNSLTEAIEKLDHILGSQTRIGLSKSSTVNTTNIGNSNLTVTGAGAPINNNILLAKDRRPYLISETNIIDAIVKLAADIGTELNTADLKNITYINTDDYSKAGGSARSLADAIAILDYWLGNIRNFQGKSRTNFENVNNVSDAINQLNNLLGEFSEINSTNNLKTTGRSSLTTIINYLNNNIIGSKTNIIDQTVLNSNTELFTDNSLTTSINDLGKLIGNRSQKIKNPKNITQKQSLVEMIQSLDSLIGNVKEQKFKDNKDLATVLKEIYDKYNNFAKYINNLAENMNFTQTQVTSLTAQLSGLTGGTDSTQLTWKQLPN